MNRAVRAELAPQVLEQVQFSRMTSASWRLVRPSGSIGRYSGGESTTMPESVLPFSLPNRG